MARVELVIAGLANRITVKTMLEAEGHEVVDGQSGVLITDDAALAEDRAAAQPTLLLTAAGVPRAVAAMRKGVHGYIFLPFQPGEVGMMVRRAAERTLPMVDPPLKTLEEVETEYIRHALRRCKNNQARTARVLGIGRNTLWRKLKHVEERGKQYP